MDAVQEIKDKLDIVEIIRGYIPLTQAGKNFKAVCPFHKEKTPSFIVSPERQSWHCFGQCNEGGDVISFVMKYENVEFYEALKALAEKAGIELKQFNPAQEKEFGILYDIQEAAAKFFEDQFEQNEDAKFYLKQRGIHSDTQKEFQIGFAPYEKDSLTVHLINAGYSAQDIERSGLSFKTERGTYMDRFRGRIMFPLKNTFGKTTSFSGRILPKYDTENVGKYINGPESPIFNKSRLLYAFDKAKQEVKKNGNIIIVEGQMDLVTLFQEGIRNVVATSGTALTQQHLQTIKKITDNIVFAFDKDDAGFLAAERALDMAHLLDFSAKLFFVSDGKDASEYISKNPGKIQTLIEHTKKSPFQFYYERFFLGQFKDDIKRASRAFLQKILMLASPIDQNIWLQQLSVKTGIPERVLYEEMVLLKKTSTETQKNNQEKTVETIPETRLEKILSRIVLICATYPNLIQETESYNIYIPEDVSVLLNAIKNPKTQITNEQKSKLELIEMKSSVEILQDNEENVLNEIRVLLRELKSEFLKSKSEKILSDIKESEREGNLKKGQELLKEFDELTKLRNTD